jgi:histone deacetylase 6
MEGKWENGFAVIRPPGHHSGAKNTINGFCIYNNVAIGANYIL